MGVGSTAGSSSFPKPENFPPLDAMTGRASEEDHIVALATAPGKSAIALIRLSGPNPRLLVKGIFQSASQEDLIPRRPTLGQITGEGGEVLDQVLLTWFPAPASYTGEDVIEVSCHGSLLIVQQIIHGLLCQGARMAEPGEFTKRAFLRGKLDLPQAEAVRDLIESQTAFQARLAAEQLGGRLSRRLEPVRTKLVQILSHMETSLEFLEDEVTPEGKETLLGRQQEITRDLEQLAGGFELGRLVRAGIEVAITGSPNAGKSSIFNALLRNNRALVTAVPGTTRDAVSETISIEGLPARLVDTAGIREARDQVEELGIEKTREYLARSDVILFVLDRNAAFESGEREIWKLVRERPTILVLNKQDLPQRLLLPEELERSGCQEVSTSALRGEGMEHLAKALWREVTPETGVEKESFFLTNIRHYEAVRAAIRWMEKGICAYQEGLSEEYAIYDFRKALESLGTIVGETTVDDILDQIFSTFCIGK